MIKLMPTCRKLTVVNKNGDMYSCLWTQTLSSEQGSVLHYLLCAHENLIAFFDFPLQDEGVEMWIPVISSPLRHLEKTHPF